jgi:hypothetical protein
MEIIRSAIPLTSPLNCSFKTGSFRIFSAIRAPWAGGLEYIGRIKIYKKMLDFVQRKSKHLDLWLDSGSLFRILADDSEGTCSLAVESHVLGERLREEDVVTVLDELSDGEGVLVDRAGGESLNFLLQIKFWVGKINLVGHIEEDEEFLLLANGGELLPLFWKRVDASRVVSASV